MGRRKKKPFDEVFKNRAKRFFEKFATVKTEYEILRAPRRIDMLVIETDKPIKEHTAFFQYFRKFNIIEFKSEVDPFQMDDLYKIGYYCNAFLLKEKQYTDIWTNDEYLQFMYERLVILRELLSDTGSIYVHCDPKRGHYLKTIAFCSGRVQSIG